MLMLIAAVVVLFVLDDVTRRGPKGRLIEDFRYSVFALRDRLRLLAIDERIEMDAWFDVVDSSLTAAIVSADKMSLLHLLAVTKTTPKARLNAMVSQFNKALAERPELNSVVDDYRTLVWDFLRARNPILAALWTDDGSNGQARNKKQRRRVIDAVHVARDFSTLPDMLPCAA